MDAREKNAAAQVVEKVEYELSKVIEMLNRNFYARISKEDAEEVCEHFVKKIVHSQMKMLMRWQEFSPENDIFQTFGKTKIFEMLEVNAEVIAGCANELILEANLFREIVKTGSLLEDGKTERVFWDEECWNFTRKPKLFLLTSLCEGFMKNVKVNEFQRVLSVLTHEINIKIREEMISLKNPYFPLRKREFHNAPPEPTRCDQYQSDQELDVHKKKSLLLNGRNYCVVEVYEKAYAGCESAESYRLRCCLIQKFRNSFAYKEGINTVLKRLHTKTNEVEGKIGSGKEHADVSQYTHTVNIPIKKQRIVKDKKAENAQVLDCFEAQNKQEEEQLYQQCVKKTQVLDNIKCFDFSQFFRKKETCVEKSKISKFLNEDFNKENETGEDSHERSTLSKGFMSSVYPSTHLTPSRKECIPHKCTSEKISGNSVLLLEPNLLFPPEKPGLQKPEDVACGGFSENKTKRRSREEPRPRTDPPEDSDLVHDYEIKSLSGSEYFSTDNMHISHQFSELPAPCDLSEDRTSVLSGSIRQLKDPPVQTSYKVRHKVFEFDDECCWIDTSLKIILEDVHHHTDPPDLWNLMATSWRRAQEEDRPRKDPPSPVHHRHQFSWLDHHAPAPIMAHG